MKVIILTINENIVEVQMEDGTTIVMDKALVPLLAHTGDVLTIDIDEEETSRRKRRAEELVRQAWDE